MIREVIAKRLSGAMEYSATTMPILKELAIPAKELSHSVFSLRDWFKEPAPSFTVERGKAYGENAGQWYKVSFSKAISNPEVVAVGEARSGEISTKDVNRVSDLGIPSVAIAKPTVSIAKPTVSTPTISISIPTVSISKVEIRAWHCKACDYGWFSLVSQSSCPQCGSYNIEENTYGNKYQWIGWYISLWNCKKQLGDWGVLNWIRDIIASAWAWFGWYVMGKDSIFVLFDAQSAQVDKVREGVQTAINQSIDNTKAGVQTGINSSIANVQGGFNTAIDKTISGVQDAVNKALDNAASSTQSGFNSTINSINDKIPDEQMNYVRDRVNARLNDLYAMWGVPESIALTPAHVRNITSVGFEFLSLGKTTIHWIAIGD